MQRHLGLSILIAVGTLFGAPGPLAQDPNVCDLPGEEPDVIVGELHQLNRYGTSNGITAFSVGTISCNVGTCWLDWCQNINRHPVIGQNMYRLAGGRFEMIGQSWLKHGFFALSGSVCFGDCLSTNGEHLGVHCSDPYDANLNGQQSRLGPRSDVTPNTGLYGYPFPTQGQSGNTIYKRLQVKNADLNPALNPGASYYVEGMYVGTDDAVAGNAGNNASWRTIDVTGTDPTFSATLTGATIRQQPAIFAWKSADPAVEIRSVLVPEETGICFSIPAGGTCSTANRVACTSDANCSGANTCRKPDGLFLVGARATALGNGMWRYEYAVQNQTSHRAARSFRVALPAGANVSSVGFHDVDYHSGEPYDGTDWAVTGSAPADGFIEWSSATFETNPNANALRWNTLYNFRLDVDAAPTAADAGTVLVGLFRPGTSQAVAVATVAPTACDGDGVCDLGEDCASCAADCADQGGGGGCCGDAVCDPGEVPCSCWRDCGAPAPFESLCDDREDEDCDGRVDCEDPDCCAGAACDGADEDMDGFALCDCDDQDDRVWTLPGEVGTLSLSHDATGGVTTVSWLAPIEPGALGVTYDTIRAQNALGFMGNAVCLADGDPTDLTASDATAPAANAAYFFLVRAVNACASGPLGSMTGGLPRSARTCP